MAKICWCGFNRDIKTTFPDKCRCYKCCANVGTPQGPIVEMTMGGGGTPVSQSGGVNPRRRNRNYIGSNRRRY